MQFCLFWIRYSYSSIAVCKCVFVVLCKLFCIAGCILLVHCFQPCSITHLIRNLHDLKKSHYHHQVYFQSKLTSSSKEETVAATRQQQLNLSWLDINLPYTYIKIQQQQQQQHTRDEQQTKEKDQEEENVSQRNVDFCK